MSQLSRLHFDGALRAPLGATTWAAFERSALIPGNPSSVHQAGQEARRSVEAAAQKLRGWLQVPERARILWAGSFWEARVLLLLSLGRPTSSAEANGRHVLWLGESAQDEPFAAAARAAGLALTVIPLHQASTAPVPACAADGSPWARIIVEAASPHSGHLMALAPSGPLAAVLHDAPWALLLGPAAPLWPELAAHTLAPDAIVLDGASVGGPEGMTALALAQGATVTPLWPGGGQQEGLRSGTVAKDGAVGLAAALAAVPAPVKQRLVGHLRDDLERWLIAELGAHICGADLPRLPHVSLVHLPGGTMEPLQQQLWRRRLAVGVGRCFCGQQGLRIGLHPEHTVAHLERLQGALVALCKGPKTCAKGRA